MKTEVLALDMSTRTFCDVTTEVERFAAAAGAEGLVHVFVPHATAGLAVIETGSGTESDLQDALDRLLPRDDRYAHRHGSPGHGADHVLPAFLAPSVTLPVVEGRLALGTWQSVVLVDPNRDNPRRNVRLSFVPG
ncbi:MAG: secondary thiamine-phosphate synthase enzyme YjbQ [Actinomycetota bacterium]